MNARGQPPPRYTNRGAYDSRTARLRRRRHRAGTVVEATIASQPRLHCSQVNLRIFGWRGATDQQITSGGRAQWIRLVSNLAADQAALAGVTDAGATRPPNGNVACFCQLQQVGETE